MANVNHKFLPFNFIVYHTLLTRKNNAMEQNTKLTNFPLWRINISFVFRAIRANASVTDKIHRRRFAVMYICII